MVLPDDEADDRAIERARRIRGDTEVTRERFRHVMELLRRTREQIVNDLRSRQADRHGGEAGKTDLHPADPGTRAAQEERGE